ncbi:MAG: Mrp/NBP35 family ATP-binding protein [Chloroflexota bacterium]
MLSQIPVPKRMLPGVAKVVAVASGKGGVGKTTTSVNLALALAQRGAQVGLYDGDLYGPNVPLMLGVRRQKSRQGYVPIARADAKPYIQPLERFGLKMMSIGLVMGSKDPITPDPRTAGTIILQTLCDVIWDGLDYLIIDLPPGTGEPQQSLLQSVQIDGVVIVTTPQDLSLMDAERSVGLFREAGARILGIVENMSYLTCPHCDEPIEVFHRSDKSWQIDSAEIELLGRVPMDIAISQGIDAGHPLIEEQPDALQVLVFQEIAERVIKALEEESM